jgi:hypothetical protein
VWHWKWVYDYVSQVFLLNAICIYTYICVCADCFVQVLIVMIESLKILNGDASVRLMDRIDKILRLDWIVEVLG